LFEVNLINYTTKDFISKSEELFISKQDTFYTKEVIAEFKKAGLTRRVVTKIWNKGGAFRVGYFSNIKEKKLIKIDKNF